MLKVNGARIAPPMVDGYLSVTRRWRRGDVLDLSLPMPVRRIVANDRVAADRDRVALQRGPIVYAAEWPDNANGRVRNLVLPDGAALDSAFRPDLLNGVTGRHGSRLRAGDEQRRTAREDGANNRRHSVLDVGESRPRRNGGVARADRCRGAADAVSHPRDRRAQSPRRGRRIRAASTTARSRRRRTTRPRTSTGGRPKARPSGSSTRSRSPRRSLKSRSTGSTIPAAAKCACQRPGGSSTRTGRLEAGGGARRVWRREGCLQHRPVYSGDDDRPAARGDDATAVVGGRAGVEGQVSRHEDVP